MESLRVAFPSFKDKTLPKFNMIGLPTYLKQKDYQITKRIARTVFLKLQLHTQKKRGRKTILSFAYAFIETLSPIKMAYNGEKKNALPFSQKLNVKISSNRCRSSKNEKCMWQCTHSNPKAKRSNASEFL